MQIHLVSSVNTSAWVLGAVPQWHNMLWMLWFVCHLLASKDRCECPLSLPVWLISAFTPICFCPVRVTYSSPCGALVQVKAKDNKHTGKCRASQSALISLTVARLKFEYNAALVRYVTICKLLWRVVMKHELMGKPRPSLAHLSYSHPSLHLWALTLAWATPQRLKSGVWIGLQCLDVSTIHDFMRQDGTAGSGNRPIN